MNRILFALPLAAILAAPAFAATGVAVINHSGLPIDELYASAPGQKAFGANLMDGLKEGALDDGKSTTVAALADGTYDLKISAPDEGILCTVNNVKIKHGKIELTPAMGKACK